jgi:ribonuclease H / adenosylcobalamin/alpha-ribazole phosphatase
MGSVIMARHGESDYSVAGLLNGDPRIACGLTALGLAQARRLGYELEGVPLDLCLTSEFERTRLTATEALAGRGIPSLVVPGFNDPRYGRYEGAALEEYRAWAASAPSSEPAPGGGESRHGLVERYRGALAELAELPEATILLVAHSLPIAWALAARDGAPPRPRTALVEYATPVRLGRAELERSVEVLTAWLGAPDW